LGVVAKALGDRAGKKGERRYQEEEDSPSGRFDQKSNGALQQGKGSSRDSIITKQGPQLFGSRAAILKNQNALS